MKKVYNNPNYNAVRDPGKICVKNPSETFSWRVVEQPTTGSSQINPQKKNWKMFCIGAASGAAADALWRFLI